MGIHKNHYPPEAMPWGMWSCPLPVEVITYMSFPYGVMDYLGQKVLSFLEHQIFTGHVPKCDKPNSQNDWADDDCCEEGKVSDEVGDQRTHGGVETKVIDKVEAETTRHIVELEEN